MDDPNPNALQARLTEKLAESLEAPLPVGTPRRIYGRVALPGKATAVIGMRRAGKTTFLHQLRGDRLERGVGRERLPFIDFEDERLVGIVAKDLHPLVEEYYRRHPALRGRETVTWCFDEWYFATAPAGGRVLHCDRKLHGHDSGCVRGAQFLGRSRDILHAEPLSAAAAPGDRCVLHSDGELRGRDRGCVRVAQ